MSTLDTVHLNIYHKLWETASGIEVYSVNINKNLLPTLSLIILLEMLCTSHQE